VNSVGVATSLIAVVVGDSFVELLSVFQMDRLIRFAICAVTMGSFSLSSMDPLLADFTVEWIDS